MIKRGEVKVTLKHMKGTGYVAANKVRTFGATKRQEGEAVNADLA